MNRLLPVVCLFVVGCGVDGPPLTKNQQAVMQWIQENEGNPNDIETLEWDGPKVFIEKGFFQGKRYIRYKYRTAGAVRDRYFLLESGEASTIPPGFAEVVGGNWDDSQVLRDDP